MRKYFIAAASAAVATATVAQADDPYVWLEDIQGARTIEQVKAWNAETEAVLTKMPGFEEHRGRAAELLNDPNQIATACAAQLEAFDRDAAVGVRRPAMESCRAG